MKKNGVLLIINTQKKIPERAVDKVVSILSGRGITVYSFSEAKSLIEKSSGSSRITFIDDNSVPDCISFAVVFGGDGSIIRAASRISSVDIPMVGVNFGAVGYLAELECEDIPLIEKIVNGEYEIDSRMMIEAEIPGRSLRLLPALNDVVLSNGPVANLLSFDLFCNDVRLRNYRADGIIVATATGSTAYSMSAGGPVLDPSLSALCVTPICPHSLGSRPVVLRDDSVIDLKNISCRKNSVYLTIDGRDAIRLEDGETVRVRKSERRTRLIRLKTNDFFGVLKNKISDSGL